MRELIGFLVCAYEYRNLKDTLLKLFVRTCIQEIQLINLCFRMTLDIDSERHRGSTWYGSQIRLRQLVRKIRAGQQVAITCRIDAVKLAFAALNLQKMQMKIRTKGQLAKIARSISTTCRKCRQRNTFGQAPAADRKFDKVNFGLPAKSRNFRAQELPIYLG